MIRRLAPLLGLPALLACGDDVQLSGLTVAIVTDTPAEFDTVVVEASRGSAEYAETFTVAQLPGSLFFGCRATSPQDCDRNAVSLRIAGRQGATQERIVRTAVINYTEDGTNRLLPMPLCASCLDIECGSEETCVRGACLDREVDANALVVDDPGLPLDDGECARTKCTGACDAGCGACPPESMVSIDSGGTPFGIDSHEVTRDDYLTFLEADVTLEGQTEACAWNRDYAPDRECMAKDSVCDGEDCGAHPQVCVDWCDAAAYCQWRGMRLCGSRDGGSVPMDGRDDSMVSQWYAACSSNAANRYPYGAEFVEQRCNDAAAEVETTTPVGTSPNCVTGDGLFDLSGNVSEWTDRCADNNGDPRFEDCETRGGSFGSTEASLSCEVGDDGGFVNRRDRDSASANVGFRCCAP